jgi:hypothetical protein
LEGSEEGTFCCGNTFSTIFREEAGLFSSSFLTKKLLNQFFLKKNIKLGSIHHPIQNIDYKLDKLIEDNLDQTKFNTILF